MPVGTSKSNVSVPERVSHAVRKMDEARLACLEAAKSLDCEELPTELHRDVLFAMDNCRDTGDKVWHAFRRMGGVL